MAMTDNQYDLLKLDSQLCFAFYSVSRAITNTYRDRLEKLGITYPEYLVLLVLWESNGLATEEIAERLQIDVGELSPIVQHLESAGIVSIKKEENGGQSGIVHVTDKGRDMRDEVLDVRKFVGCALGMSQTEISVMRDDLMRILDELKSESGDATH